MRKYSKPCGNALSERAAADEVDDFKAVAISDGGGGPGRAGGNGAIVFDCDAILLKSERSEEIVKGSADGKLRE
jgi:hypothetical protein